MIVKMKRVTVLCTRSSKDETLRQLSDIGILHLTPITVAESAELDEAKRTLEQYQGALSQLPVGMDQKPSAMSGEEILERIHWIRRQRRQLREQLEKLEKVHERYQPFGSFDPQEAEALRKQGFQFSLHELNVQDKLELPEGLVCTEISRGKTRRYVAIVGKGTRKPNIQAIPLPERKLSELEKELASLQGELAQLEEERQEMGAHTELAQQAVYAAEDAAELIEARAGMNNADRISYLRGFCPVALTEEIQSTAKANGWGILIESPKPGDQVPTLITNPEWVSAIKPVFAFLNIHPGYKELDISTCFLFFFSLFFAMIVGDAGYGLVFLGLTLILKKKAANAPGHLISLLFIMSVCTIIWGLLTGNFFGIAKLPAPLSSVRVPWLTEQNNIMELCFLIGAIHLTIAHGWNAVRLGKDLRGLAQVGWIGTTWVMFFTAKTMVLGADFPPVMLTLLGISVLLIVLFMTPPAAMKTEWTGHVMLALNLINNFVDVVSYVRLFAVGMATFAMASAFNGMAAGASGAGSILGYVAAALIIFLGHGMNILLAAMGVMVHGIRLNTLEFSGHLGMTWTGTPYSPFKRKTKQPVEKEAT